jgi:hypothetical protein
VGGGVCVWVDVTGVGLFPPQAVKSSIKIGKPKTIKTDRLRVRVVIRQVRMVMT